MNEGWKNRKNGYYWVRDRGEWLVAEWRGEGKGQSSWDELNWYICGDEIDFKDSDFDEIRELPIAPPLPDPMDFGEF